MLRVKTISVILVVVSACCVGGCDRSRPNSAEVSGVVTLDGEPLAKADVIFKPATGRSSLGITNARGEYTLRFTATKIGAVPGTHTISITTAVDEPDGVGPRAKERVPARYRGPRSTLIHDVKRGANRINFDLTTTTITEEKSSESR